MKKVLSGSVFILSLLLISCSGGGAEGSAEKVTAMTCTDIESQADSLKGQEITITVISWGNNNVMDGGVKMNLGDVKLEGMKQAHVVANFSAENKASAESVEKDAKVTITATVGEFEYGAVQLVNPVIVK